MREARAAFEQAGIPTYNTPEEAVRAFLQVVQYRNNQDLLMEVPPTRSSEFVHDREKAQAVVASAVAEGRAMLSEPEAKAVLAAYGIPVVDTRIARTIEEAVRVATEIGYPVAVKILSPEITHKSDVGGVALDLEDCGRSRRRRESDAETAAPVPARCNVAGIHRANDGAAA